MTNFKKLVGKIPSRVVSTLIRQSVPSQRAGRLVDMANAYPNWFGCLDDRFLVHTKFGFSIWCDRWDVIGKAIVRNGQWEGLLSATLAACLRPGDVAIDIGANMGYDTMLMSIAVGADGCVVAFEPDQWNLLRLLENLGRLPYPNVVVQSLGLGEETTMTRIAIADAGNRGMSNLRPGEHGPSQPTLVNRLDRVLSETNFQKIRLVKIDIEGYEYKAILGMGTLLDRVEIVTCEIDPAFLQQCGASPSEVFEIMTRNGFESYCSQPNSTGHWIRSGPDFKIAVA